MLFFQKLQGLFCVFKAIEDGRIQREWVSYSLFYIYTLKDRGLLYMAKRQWKSKRWSKGGPSVEERVKELVSVLDEGARNFEYSPEEFKALLEMKALMPNYSFKNIMVAKTQFPNASYIASFKRWNELGRNIKLGSKAIRIFKPKFIKVKDEHGNETGETQLVGFITVPVFALEQVRPYGA